MVIIIDLLKMFFLFHPIFELWKKCYLILNDIHMFCWFFSRWKIFILFWFQKKSNCAQPPLHQPCFPVHFVLKARCDLPFTHAFTALRRVFSIWNGNALRFQPIGKFLLKTFRIALRQTIDNFVYCTAFVNHIKL